MASPAVTPPWVWLASQRPTRFALGHEPVENIIVDVVGQPCITMLAVKPLP
jgi:hypothetical protein